MTAAKPNREADCHDESQGQEKIRGRKVAGSKETPDSGKYQISGVGIGFRLLCKL